VGLPCYLSGMDGFSRGSLSCFSIQRMICLLFSVVTEMDNVNCFTLVTVFLVVFVIFSQVTLDNFCFLSHKLK